MVDRIAETLESASASIGRASAWDVALMCSIIIVIGLPLLTLVHELGHAIAVRLRGLPLESIVVGNTDDLTFRAGAVIVRLGRVLQDEGPAGYVRYEPTRASASDVIVIALAGPLANLAVAPVFAALALAGGIGGAPEACLWLLSAGSVMLAVGNLVPRGRPGTSDRLSDGRLVELAWAQRGRPVSDWTDVAPTPPAPSPASEPPSPEPVGGFRWPFAAALLLVAVVCFAAGGVLLLVPLVVMFGGAFLAGAHRHEIW